MIIMVNMIILTVKIEMGITIIRIIIMIVIMINDHNDIIMLMILTFMIMMIIRMRMTNNNKATITTTVIIIVRIIMNKDTSDEYNTDKDLINDIALIMAATITMIQW